MLASSEGGTVSDGCGLMLDHSNPVGYPAPGSEQHLLGNSPIARYDVMECNALANPNTLKMVTDACKKRLPKSFILSRTITSYVVVLLSIYLLE